jgi:hypothetical protein
MITEPTRTSPQEFCVALVAYYLAWKYLVNFFNGVAGIA